MRNEPLLTRDELIFLQQLLDDPAYSAKSAHELTLNSSPDTQTLLANLGENAQLTLEARVGNQRLTFPLRLILDEFRALSLQLEVPQIFEKGVVERPWRATLDTPLSLTSKNGQASALWVQQISQNGALVSSSDGSEPPEHFVLGLALPGKAFLSLRGSRVRQLSPTLAAYRITPSHHSGIQRLQELLVQLRNQEQAL